MRYLTLIFLFISISCSAQFFWSHTYISTIPYTVKNGYLYNNHAVSEARHISNAGWEVPSEASWDSLITYCGGSLFAGGRLKQTGTTYWNSPNTSASDSVNFRARGSGWRAWPYSFDGIGVITAYKNSSLYHVILYYNNNDAITSSVQGGSDGNAIRLKKTFTNLTHGQTGTYTGNDGRVYHTICIGTQEWLQENLAETKYRNGDVIPTVTDQTTWEGLSTGAKCAYNNDESNVFF